MAADKICRKKLTNSGTGVCVLAFFALLISAAGAALEFISTYAYNHFYDRQITAFFAPDVNTYLSLYEKCIIMAVFSLIMFIWAAGAKKRKKLGREFGVLAIIVPIALCVVLGMNIANSIIDGSLYSSFSGGTDGDKFRAAIDLAIDAIPVVSGFLLLIAGLAALGRLSDESFTVQIPYVLPSENAAVPASQDIPVPVQGAEDNISYMPPAEDSIENIKADIQPEISQPKAEPASAELASGVCPKCGSAIEGEESFCANCGAKLR